MQSVPATPTKFTALAPARPVRRRANGVALLGWIGCLACGAVLGIGAAAPHLWAASTVALTTWMTVMVALSRQAPAQGTAAVMAGLLGWQVAGMGWVVLAVRAVEHRALWQAAVVAITVGVQLLTLWAIWRYAAWAASRVAGAHAQASGVLVARFVLALACHETVRQAGWWGVGYANLALPFLDVPGAAAWVAVLGGSGWAALVASLCGTLAVAVFRVMSGRPQAAARALAPWLLLAGGVAAWHGPSPAPTSGTLTVVPVPPPAAPGLPWTLAARDLALAQLGQAIRAAPPGAVVATSETYFPEPPPRDAENAWQDLLHAVRRAQVELLVGMPHLLRDSEGLHLMNSVVQVSAQRQSLYAKERLVPGGEYLPWPQLLGPVYAHLRDGRRLSQRSAPPELTAPLFVAGHVVGVSICHELGFALTMAGRARDSGWLLNLADDSWIDSTLYRQQMLAMARLRAMEAGKPLVRVSHGAPSVWVDGSGRVRATSTDSPAHVPRFELRPVQGLSPYHRHATAWSVLPWLIAAGLGLRALLRPATVTP